MEELRNERKYRDPLRQLAFYRGLFLCAFVLDVKATMTDFRFLHSPIELGIVRKRLPIGFEGIFVVTEKIAFFIPPCFASEDIVVSQTH